MLGRIALQVILLAFMVCILSWLLWAIVPIFVIFVGIYILHIMAPSEEADPHQDEP